MSTITNSNGKRKLFDEIGQFATLPFSFIEGSKGLSYHARWLFVTLRYYTNRTNGKAWPSYDTIRKLTGMRRPMINKSIKELEQAGWLKKETQKGKSNTYTLLIPKPVIPKAEAKAVPAPHSTYVDKDGNSYELIPCSDDDDELPF